MWEEAERFLLNDKYIAPLILKYGPCTIKPIKKTQYFEDLVDAITSQQLSGKAAKTIFERVKIACGGKVTSEKLMKLGTDELRKCGLSYAKCSYVIDLAVQTQNSSLKIQKLNTLLDEKVIEELTKVKGIGRWTAEMFLMFGLARSDIFPVDDLGISKSVNQLFNKSLNKKQLEKIGLMWKPYRTVASWYLWRSLENR